MGGSEQMEEIFADIQTLNKSQRVAIACMYVASLSPVVSRFARPATRCAFEQGLEVAWNAVRGTVADPRTTAARRCLDDTCESECDDSNSPAYEVMRAVGALACTLDAVLDESVDAAREACDLVMGSCIGIDYVLEHGTAPRRVDPRNPPPRGRFESLLVQMQSSSITALRRATNV